MASLGKPGVYLDTSPTGAGKSYADAEAIKRAGSSLVVVPVHENCREAVNEFAAAGVDAVAYPQLTEDNCIRHHEAAKVQAAGLTVPPGGTFTYQFKAVRASLFWYHPHVMSAPQVGFGLYGALLVEDPDEGVGVADEVTIVLSDIGFNAKGDLESRDSGGSAGMVFGREGAYVLANGRIVKSGGPDLAREVEKNGYGWVEEHAGA